MEGFSKLLPNLLRKSYVERERERESDWKVTPDRFPFFFDIILTSQSYLAKLKEKFWSRVQRQEMFWQAGALAHYDTVVQQWLNDKFDERWIGPCGFNE